MWKPTKAIKPTHKRDKNLVHIPIPEVYSLNILLASN